MSGELFDGVYKNRTVLVTGHTGFKGAWLSLWLAKLGARVVGYALEPPTEPNLFALTGLDRDIIHLVGDVRDEARLKGVFETYRPEIVFHLAAQALVRASYVDPKLTYETNVIGTVNLFEAVRSCAGTRAIVNVTSDKCYENREWVWGYRENEPLGGYDPYASSKSCVELITAAYRNSFFNPENYETHGIALASARAGNVIGGGDWAEDRLIPDCMRALLRNKEIVIRSPKAIRPWQHVLEPLRGYLLLAQKLRQEGVDYGGAWNFGPDDDDAKPVEWIAERVCAKWGANASYSIDHGNHPHETHCLKLDCAKAKSGLGWKPIWDLEQALNSIIDWTRAYQGGKDMRAECLKQIDAYSGPWTGV